MFNNRRKSYYRNIFEGDDDKGLDFINPNLPRIEEPLGRLSGYIDPMSWETFQYYIPFESFLSSKEKGFKGFTTTPHLSICEGLHITSDEDAMLIKQITYDTLKKTAPEFIKGFGQKKFSPESIMSLPMIKARTGNLGFLTQKGSYAILKYDIDSPLLEVIYGEVKKKFKEAYPFRPYLAIAKVEIEAAEYVLDQLYKNGTDPHRNSEVGISKILLQAGHRKWIFDYADRFDI